MKVLYPVLMDLSYLGDVLMQSVAMCAGLCRRLERRMLALELVDNYKPSHVSISYVNRLSDYLFVLAKKLNYIAGVSEKLYVISRK